MLGLHVCSLSALLPSSARQPRQQQLLMLRDIAQVKQNLAKAQEAVVAGGVADTTALFASLTSGTKELASNLRRFDEPMIQAQPESSWPRWTSTLNPGRLQTTCRWGPTLQTLQSQASELHEQVDEQREQLELFRSEEMGTERVQQVFDAIDVKGDGMVCLEEFTKASSTLLATSFGLSGEALNKELQSRFERADVDKNGTLDFHEFQAPNPSPSLRIRAGPNPSWNPYLQVELAVLVRDSSGTCAATRSARCARRARAASRRP